MGRYLTFEQLSKTDNAYSLLHKLNETYRLTSNAQKISVFLSHKHSENANLINQVRGFFASMGANVYIDWLDSDMPKVTNAETAEKLKSKIRLTDKFVILATPQSIESIWMPWEIGLADQINGLANIAILPVVHENGVWTSREYYQLYSTIERVEDMWVVIEPGCQNKGIQLKNWLQL